MRKFGLIILLFLACGNGLYEGGAEYNKLVLEHMGTITEDADIDSVQVDESILYIYINKPLARSEFNMIARGNAVRFSKFKKEKLGVSGVAVMCVYNNKIYAEASARRGVIVEEK